MKVISPCIGVCSTGIGDTVCRGCKRYLHEISGWLAYSDDERRAIVNRLSSLVRQVAEPVVAIHDSGKLEAALNRHRIRYDRNADPYVWLLELLKMGASSLPNLEAFGCEVRPEHADKSLTMIRDQIDQDFFSLSVAHHDRYFGSML